MKKAISFSLVLGMIFLPCVGVRAQKSARRVIDRSAQQTERSFERTGIKGLNVFGRISAETSGDGVLLKWEMRAENANMGFYIHRAERNDESVINQQLVFGSAAKTGRYPLYGEQYSFFDSFGGPDSTYSIESIDLDGNRVESGNISTQFTTNSVTRPAGVPGNSDNVSAASGAFESQQVNVTKEIASQIDRLAAPPDPDKHKWVMSRPGARIDVKTEGIYRVPFAQLQAAGFDTNSDKGLWQLFRNGLEQAFTINEAASYLEFYGKGVDTPETEVQGYFLVTGDVPGKRIENAVARPTTSSITLPSYSQTSTYKERIYYIDTILNGSAENYWGRGIGAAGTDFNFDLTGIDFNNANSTLEVKVQGFSAGAHTVRITLNGQLLEPITGVAQFPYSITQTIPTSLLKDASLGQGPNVLNLASVGAGPPADFNLFDNAKVTFARKHKALQNTLKAYTVSNKNTQLTGFSSANVRVFDITFENDPRMITNLTFQDQGGGVFGAQLAATRGRVIFAVEDSKILAPFAVNRNDGEVLGSTLLGADLIIIAYKDLAEKAERWANYRRSQGLSVKVVDVEEIFNEFNYGSPSSDSIESFLNYTYNNWSTTPRYVLLMGDATRDPRNYTGLGYFNYVPTRMVTTIFTETGSDESLADFDHDGLAEMSVGRIPARTGAQVDNIYQKVTNWEANLGSDPLSRGTLFAVDQFDANNNLDFAAITDRIKGELPASVPKTVVNKTQPNAQTDLIAALNTSPGKYMVNYTGHGSASVWSSTGFFWSGNVPSLTNHDSESIFTMLTCLNGYFLFPDNSLGLAETLLDYTNGGAVAAWASTGLTTPDVQEIMARRFYKTIGEGSIPSQRLGDYIRDAKSVIAGGTDVRLSWALLGDPLLKTR